MMDHHLLSQFSVNELLTTALAAQPSRFLRRDPLSTLMRRNTILIAVPVIALSQCFSISGDRRGRDAQSCSIPGQSGSASKHDAYDCQAYFVCGSDRADICLGL
jgi:hypothetical protein